MSLSPEKSSGAMFRSYKQVSKNVKYRVSSADTAQLFWAISV
jgi:hypothetical protein